MSGLRVWAGVREHARVLAMPVTCLVSPVVGSGAGRCATLPPGGTRQRAVRTIRVTIAHQQRLLRAALRGLLEREAGIALVDEAANADEAVALARRSQPDVVLMDVSLPGLGCVEVTRRILDETPAAVMLLAASETDDRVLATLRAGARPRCCSRTTSRPRSSEQCSAVAVGFAPGDPIAGNPQGRFRC
jgi:CheY-like chemotaxis protein